MRGLLPVTNFYFQKSAKTIWIRRLIRVAVLGLCSQTPAFSAECATCHPAEAALHARTAHASAAMPAQLSPFALHLPDHALGEALDGYLFTYQRSPMGILAIAQRGEDRAEGFIQWVLGSGRRGETPIISLNGRMLEHRVSFYTETGKYGITTGQANGASASAAKALGLYQSDKDLHSCLDCHSTNLSVDSATFTPGVQCERCHAGAAQHAQGHGKPVNPGTIGNVAQVRLCGTCHRNTPPNGDDNDPANVRFQPLRLMKSRCFIEGKVACTTCHPAHQDAKTNDVSGYNARCLNCHGAALQEISRKLVKHDTGSDCIGCHMPRSRPHPALEFADHFIRVVAGSPGAQRSSL